MDNNEALADILAQFRKFALRAAEEDKMISPESVLLLADKVEAAAKRERDPLAKPRLCKSCKHLLPDGCEICGCSDYVEATERAVTKHGNAAALREALEIVKRRLYGWLEWWEIADEVEAALSAPPRNCDKFETFLEAREAFFSTYVPDETENSASAFAAWLMATAKGGAE